MTEKEKQVRQGHRQRLKQQFLRSGLDSFDDPKALELLLTFAIPRKDTKPIAQGLLEHFGSFANVLDASYEKLVNVEGVTPNAATLICVLRESARKQILQRSTPDAPLKTLDECGRFLISYFQGKQNEEVYLLCLDIKGAVIHCRRIGEGSVNSANVPIRKIVAAALDVNAAAVVLAHNHPAGVALPSKEDIHATTAVQNALDAVGIQMIDHVIVAGDDYISLKQSNYLPVWK